MKNRRISVPEKKMIIEIISDADKKRSTERRLTDMNSKEKKVVKGGIGMQIKLKTELDTDLKASRNSKIYDVNK